MTSPAADGKPRSGAPLWVAKLLGLALLVALAWWLVDGALYRWVNWTVRWAQEWRRPDDAPVRLPPLTELGKASARLPVVVACDAAEPTCRRRVQVLQRWQAAHDSEVRLVWLQRPAPAHRELAEALLAARQQDLLWPVLEALAARPGAVASDDVRQAVVAQDGQVLRWQRDSRDLEVALQVGTERTMAGALGLADGAQVLASGLPLGATVEADDGQLTRALTTELARLLQLAQGRDTDAVRLDRLGQLPAATRQRYISWILKGERVHGPAEPAPPP